LEIVCRARYARIVSGIHVELGSGLMIHKPEAGWGLRGLDKAGLPKSQSVHRQEYRPGQKKPAGDGGERSAARPKRKYADSKLI
jgi:hypothetical protein